MVFAESCKSTAFVVEKLLLPTKAQCAVDGRNCLECTNRRDKLMRQAPDGRCIYMLYSIDSSALQLLWHAKISSRWHVSGIINTLGIQRTFSFAATRRRWSFGWSEHSSSRFINSIGNAFSPKLLLPFAWASASASECAKHLHNWVLSGENSDRERESWEIVRQV